MADVSNEPSMEEILSSIKKIISEDSDKSLSVQRGRRLPVRDMRHDAVGADAQTGEADDVLELTELQSDDAVPLAEPMSAVPVIESKPESVGELVSPGAAAASRHALDSLATIVAKPAIQPSALTIDDLARELLRPMLKDWLDQHLPEIVEGVVAKEVARISGR
jgi:uncharacterized protein